MGLETKLLMIFNILPTKVAYFAGLYKGKPHDSILKMLRYVYGKMWLGMQTRTTPRHPRVVTIIIPDRFTSAEFKLYPPILFEIKKDIFARSELQQMMFRCWSTK